MAPLSQFLSRELDGIVNPRRPVALELLCVGPKVVSLREREELRLLCSGDKRTMDNGKIECANNVDRFVLFDGIMPL